MHASTRTGNDDRPLQASCWQPRRHRGTIRSAVCRRQREDPANGSEDGEGIEMGGGAGRREPSQRSRAARLRLATRSPAGVVAHPCAARIEGRGNRQGGLEVLPGRRTIAVRRRAQGGHGEARSGSPCLLQSLFRRQSDLSAEVPARLESVLHHGTGWSSGRRSRALARTYGFTLQPASHRAALSRRRLRGDCDQATWSRNCPGRPFRRRLGRLVGGNAAGGQGSPPAYRADATAAHDRLFQRRGAGDEICARWPRRQNIVAP